MTSITTKVQERLKQFTEENIKLQRDVEKLEEALQLRSEVTTDQTGVRGLLRQEIGGSHWEHGATGKLLGYNSVKQLSPGGSTHDPTLQHFSGTKKWKVSAKYDKTNEGSCHHSWNKGSTLTSETERVASKKKRIFEKLAKEIGLDKQPNAGGTVGLQGRGHTGDSLAIMGQDSFVSGGMEFGEDIPAVGISREKMCVVEQAGQAEENIAPGSIDVPPLWQRSEGKGCSHGDPEVAAWLRTLHLGNVEKYIKMFADHELDLETVKLLSEEQLKSMGVTAVGSISKLLFAISELRGEDLNMQILTARVKGKITPRACAKPSDKIDCRKVMSRDNGKRLNESKSHVGTKKTKSSQQLICQTMKSGSNGNQKTSNIENLKKRDKTGGLKKANVWSSRDELTGIEAAVRKAALHKKKQEIQKKRNRVAADAKRKMRDELAARHTARLAEALDMETAELAKRYQKQLDAAKAENITDVLNEVIGGHQVKGRVTNNKDVTAGGTRATTIESSTEDDTFKPLMDQKDCVRGTGHKLATPHRLPSAKKPKQNSSVSSGVTKSLLGDLKDVELKVKDLQEKAFNSEESSTDPVNELHQQLAVLQARIKELGHFKHSSPKLATSDDSDDRRTNNLAQERFQFKSTSRGAKLPTERADVSDKSLRKQEVSHTVQGESKGQYRQLRYEDCEGGRRQTIVTPWEVPEEDIYYDPSDKLGQGAFSCIFRGVFNSLEVAVKKLKLPLAAQDINYFAAEVSLLHELQHPRVVRLLGVCTAPSHPLLVFEYMAQGSLYSLLHDFSRPDLDHVTYYQISRDAALGMNHLHSHSPPVLHLDLTTRCILLDSQGRAKVTGFGFSKLRHEAQEKQSKTTSMVGIAPTWVAPELLDGAEMTNKADVYSFGIILWEMLTRELPYKDCSIYQVLEQTRNNVRPVIPRSCPDGLGNLIQRCWNANPACRPQFQDIRSSLDNLSFPSSWQRLFSAAGIPQEAMDDIQSARKIIDLVNQRLDSERRSVSPPRSTIQGWSRDQKLEDVGESDRNDLSQASRMIYSELGGVPPLTYAMERSPCASALYTDSNGNRMPFAGGHVVNDVTSRKHDKQIVTAADLIPTDLESTKLPSDENDWAQAFNVPPTCQNNLSKVSGGSFLRKNAWHTELDEEQMVQNQTFSTLPSSREKPGVRNSSKANPVKSVQSTLGSKLVVSTLELQPSEMIFTSGMDYQEKPLLKSAALIKQRLRLRPTNLGHPCQLSDLSHVSAEMMSSLTEALRKTVRLGHRL